jgi:hypothetical protein
LPAAGNGKLNEYSSFKRDPDEMTNGPERTSTRTHAEWMAQVNVNTNVAGKFAQRK